MSLEGELTRLRALEAEDVDLLYVWENDPAVWGVSGTLAPFSRHTLRRFLDEQRFDLYAARQLRLVVETLDGRAVGLVDLFEFEPVDLRAGIDAAVAALPEKCREVFTLSYLQGFSHREISERLGIAQSTVENHIYLALKALRSKLSKSELLMLLFFIFLCNNSQSFG